MWTSERVHALTATLQAFGTVRTQLSDNASRFATLLTLEFDHAANVANAAVQVSARERSNANKIF